MFKFKIVKTLALLFLLPAILAACNNPAGDSGNGEQATDTGGLRAEDISNGGLTLYWDAVEGADGYRLYVRESIKDPGEALVISTEDPAYTISGLNNGSVYYFWVKPLQEGLASGSFKDPLEVRLPVPPPDAQNIVLVRDIISIRVFWEPVIGASSYEIWYSLSSRFDDTAKQWTGPIEGTSAVVTGLVNNNTYYFWLRSVGAAGPSPFSGVKSESTGEPLNPAKPSIRWTGRMRDKFLVIWEPAANAAYYEFRYSAGNSVDAVPENQRITNIRNNAYMTEDLQKGIKYNFWVRSWNYTFCSEWSDMGTVTTGIGLPYAMHGTYFSRYPASRPYYMDGYQVGYASEMVSKFPFNKDKYAAYQGTGLPGPLAEAGVIRETSTGAPFYDDDQYVFYIADGIGGCSIGIVRAVLERTYVQMGRTNYVNYTVIESFKGSSSGKYWVVHFGYAMEDPNTLMGMNGGGITQLTLEAFQVLASKSWASSVAYPSIRLGWVTSGKSAATGPDTDGRFHPELIRPEPLWKYLEWKLPALDSVWAYFLSWNDEKQMYNWEDREQFPEDELWDYVSW
jgi:hypothetical protein